MDRLGRIIADTVCIGLGAFLVVLLYNYGFDLGLLDFSYTGPMAVCIVGAALIEIRRKFVWD